MAFGNGRTVSNYFSFYCEGSVVLCAVRVERVMDGIERGVACLIGQMRNSDKNAVGVGLANRPLLKPKRCRGLCLEKLKNEISKRQDLVLPSSFSDEGISCTLLIPDILGPNEAGGDESLSSPSNMSSAPSGNGMSIMRDRICQGT